VLIPPEGAVRAEAHTIGEVGALAEPPGDLLGCRQRLPHPLAGCLDPDHPADGAGLDVDL